ncbi:MAG: dihydrofolate reductase [Pseudomonadota bacterium]
MADKIDVALIVARSRNGVIGVDGDLPWRLADDLAYFKKTTIGCPIIMGRKTWESLPRKPLPGRDNIVLTRDTEFEAPGARVYSRLEPALEAGKSLAMKADAATVFIIGGASLYEAALPFVDTLHISEVDIQLDGDAFFPSFDETQFSVHQTASFAADARNQHPFVVKVFKRRLEPMASS